MAQKRATIGYRLYKRHVTNSASAIPVAQPPRAGTDTAVGDSGGEEHLREQISLLELVGFRETSWAPYPVDQPRPWAAACPGQQRLEFAFVRGIAHVLPGVETDPAQFLMVTHALAGPACLHLAVQSWFVPHLVHTLLPSLNDDGSLDGTPGFRHIPGRDDFRYELGAPDGHGRLVFHLDAQALDDWNVFASEDDLFGIECSDLCPPDPCPLQHLAVPGRPVKHLLHQHPGLHPAEVLRLHHGDDPALLSAVSRRLRSGLAHLPPPAPAENEHRTTRTPLSAPPPPLQARQPHTAPAHHGTDTTLPPASREPAEIPATAFAQNSAARTVEEYALALTRQLLALLASAVIAPGDVLYDLRGLARALGGPRSTPDATLVLRRTAARYGLVRNRLRHSDDPPAPLHADHAMTWEISPAALMMAPVIAQELARHA